MPRLTTICKAYNQSGAVNALIPLFGFVDDHVFLTKAGELGVVLKVQGRDYECLDAAYLDEITRRFEACVRSFDPNYRIYQHLIKRNGARIPHAEHYENPIVAQAVAGRLEYLEGKAEDLYTLDVYFVILYEGARFNLNLVEKLKMLAKHPGEAAAIFSTTKSVMLVEERINTGCRVLLNRVNSFVIQLSEYIPVHLAPKEEAFQFFRRLFNFSQYKADSVPLQHNTFLDYYICDSALECHRGHLRLDAFYVKVLTLKDPPATTEPNLLRRLQELPCQAIIASEFQRVDGFEMRKLIHGKRRHFHNSKTSILSHLTSGDRPKRADEVLIDDSATAMVRELGQCLTDMESKSAYFGKFVFTVILYDTDPKRLDKSVAEAFKVFAARDAVLFEEHYNLLNAFVGAFPGNHRYSRLRQMYLGNSNYADLSFLFAPHSGEPRNAHLDAEYLAAFETAQSTPYYLNLHYQDVPHTLIQGMTGAGKSFLNCYLLTHAQKYAPRTVIFDLGGSYRRLTQLFSGSYMQIGIERMAFRINPFTLPKTEANLHFLFSFLKVLIEDSGDYVMTDRDNRELHQAIDNIYQLDPAIRRLGTVMRTLPRHLEPHLSRWVEGGQYGHLFDNERDTLTFANFQTFDFEGLDKFPQILEPLLFYILHRASAMIYDPARAGQFKIFLLDEAWRFFRNETVKNYIIEALKTWRKRNAAMILATQSSADLSQNDMLQVVAESCGTLIFLANPRMDRVEYRRLFHLNETEAALIAGLTPKKELLVKRGGIGKVVQLNVSEADRWLYSNSIEIEKELIVA